VFVQPAWRGRGLSRALMQAALAHAREHVAAVHLSVTVGNHVARGLYERLGFTRYGIEPRALCIGGTFHDEELMWLDLCAS
jgi:ribosomal protein S18 acetylase RimI-like enzyme